MKILSSSATIKLWPEGEPLEWHNFTWLTDWLTIWLSPFLCVNRSRHRRVRADRQQTWSPMGWQSRPRTSSPLWRRTVAASKRVCRLSNTSPRKQSLASSRRMRSRQLSPRLQAMTATLWKTRKSQQAWSRLDQLSQCLPMARAIN